MDVPPRNFLKMSEKEIVEKLKQLAIENPDKIDKRDYVNLWTTQPQEQAIGSHRQTNSSL